MQDLAGEKAGSDLYSGFMAFLKSPGCKFSTIYMPWHLLAFLAGRYPGLIGLNLGEIFCFYFPNFKRIGRHRKHDLMEPGQPHLEGGGAGGRAKNFSKKERIQFLPKCSVNSSKPQNTTLYGNDKPF